MISSKTSQLANGESVSIEVHVADAGPALMVILDAKLRSNLAAHHVSSLRCPGQCNGRCSNSASGSLFE